MKRLTLFILAALLASSVEALSTRTLTAKVIEIDGTVIADGTLTIRPYGTRPSSTGGGVSAGLPRRIPIVNGALVCTGACSIVAPGNYDFIITVVDADGFAVNALTWRAGVVEGGGDITLQDLYAGSATPATVQNVLTEGEALTLLRADGATPGFVATAAADGSVTWGAAGGSAGDIEGVTAGTGLTGGGSSGTVALSLDSHSHGGGDVTSAVAEATHATSADSATTATSASTAATLSSALAATLGGTAADSSGWTGVPKVTAGVWSSGATAADVGALSAEADTLATITARGATSATLITLDNGNTGAGRIALKEDSDNGTNTGTLTGPASTADVTWTLPAWTGNVAVGTQVAPTTADATADLVIAASSATQTPLVVQGAAAQSVPLQEWQTSAGAVLTAIEIGRAHV